MSGGVQVGFGVERFEVAQSVKQNWSVLAVCGAVAGAVVLSVTIMGGGEGSAQTKLPPIVTEADAAPRPWRRYADSNWPTTDFSKFNTLADGSRSPPAPKQPRRPAGPVTGDPANGQKLVADRTRGGS